MAVEGKWIDLDVKCIIINVYSPCAIDEKRRLWAQLVQLKQDRGCEVLCLAGDFNEVRTKEERRGKENRVTIEQPSMREFNCFISHMEVLDIPLVWRKYTWYKPNGHAKSRLDRFLLSERGSNYVLAIANTLCKGMCPTIVHFC